MNIIAITIGIILLIIIGFVSMVMYGNKKLHGGLKIYSEAQEYTVREANQTINSLLFEYSNEPTQELAQQIFDTLGQNKTYVILTFIDNKDPNDNKTLELTNSINFRKIKNGEIGAFTDFDLMRSYVGDYISTEIILIDDFINLCKSHDVKAVKLNFTLQNPCRLTLT